MIGGLGIFMLVTALIVLVPVFLQMYSKETTLRETWGILLFAAGLVSLGLSDSAVADGNAGRLIGVGLAAAIVGLLVQTRHGDPSSPNP